ncbi:hypothetical protein CS022_10685 [Veronia nyctiphanis]|uniref:Uncharacterized protein n=1 Tax=Veronia nyctiphanis TaxID=1278244 RepID=A0A4Q0YQB7_9GAMM|nr:hypothetical protein [Veronia nyctiphanis]RXJ73206.1 hypothetical protein CS022_10685 [Veronia nyctiphanis]
MRVLFGINFIRGLLKMPLHWQGWVAVLVLVNGIIPLYFLPHPIAIVTLVAFVSGMYIGFMIAEIHGFTKLLSIMHGSWIPLLAFQMITLVSDSSSIDGLLYLWLLASTTVTFLSLVFDVFDFISYTRGNRHDLLES